MWPINDCALLLRLRYWLGPREDKSDPVIKQDLGSLRLRVCHSQDYVFPSSFYDPLRETILGMGDGQVYVLLSVGACKLNNQLKALYLYVF